MTLCVPNEAHAMDKIGWIVYLNTCAHILNISFDWEDHTWFKLGCHFAWLYGTHVFPLCGVLDLQVVYSIRGQEFWTIFWMCQRLRKDGEPPLSRTSLKRQKLASPDRNAGRMPIFSSFWILTLEMTCRSEKCISYFDKSQAQFL